MLKLAGEEIHERAALFEPDAVQPHQTAFSAAAAVLGAWTILRIIGGIIYAVKSVPEAAG